MTYEQLITLELSPEVPIQKQYSCLDSMWWDYVIRKKWIVFHNGIDMNILFR
jgi:hypothetical protein